LHAAVTSAIACADKEPCSPDTFPDVVTNSKADESYSKANRLPNAFSDNTQSDDTANLCTDAISFDIAYSCAYCNHGCTFIFADSSNTVSDT
jgi:hypothetical protein